MVSTLAPSWQAARLSSLNLASVPRWHFESPRPPAPVIDWRYHLPSNLWLQPVMTAENVLTTVRASYDPFAELALIDSFELTGPHGWLCAILHDLYWTLDE
jgi:hypothetical protein